MKHDISKYCNCTDWLNDWINYNYFSQRKMNLHELNWTIHVNRIPLKASGNRKEPRLVSKLHGVELPSWVFPTCHKPVLPYVMEHWYEEKITLCFLFWYYGIFSSRKGWNLLTVVVSTISRSFISSYKYEIQISDNRWSFFSWKCSIT